MEKNGLFLCSIGLLVILYSMKPSQQLDIFSFTTGIALLGLGAFIVFRNRKPKTGDK